jgi:hypothetical protein
VADAPARDPFAVRFNRAFDVAMVFTVALWQVGADGTALLSYLERFSSAEVAVAVWAIQCLIIAVGSILLLRRSGRPVVTRWLAIAALATAVAMVVDCPPDELLRINWAWGSAGLIGVLLLMYRPLGELVAFMAANAGVVLAALLATGTLNRHLGAGFVSILYGASSSQLAMVGGARIFRSSGGIAADAAAEQWELATREAVIAEVAEARQDRYREVGRIVAPILRGLADGAADPSDPALRLRCATAESMLRQLLAEHADIPDPVLRLLQPGIDEALRRGVVVDLARVGEPPPLDHETAAALTEAALAVLARTRTSSRVTVVATGEDEVSVSVLADCDARAVTVAPAGVDVTTDHDGDLLWVEARWARA